MLANTLAVFSISPYKEMMMTDKRGNVNAERF